MAQQEITITGELWFTNEATNQSMRRYVELPFDIMEWPDDEDEQHNAIENALIRYAAKNLDQTEKDDWSPVFYPDAVTIEQVAL